MGKDSPAPIKIEPAASTELTEPIVDGLSTASVQVDNDGQYQDLVKKYFPADQIENAMIIMEHESGGNPNAVSQTADVGLFQLHTPLWTNYFGVTVEQLKDPNTNVSLAYRVWDRGDGLEGNMKGSFRSWSTYKYLLGG